MRGITRHANMNLTDFASVGIVIISVISLFVSKCRPSMFLRFLITFVDTVGVLLRTQGSQLVSIFSFIKDSLNFFLTFGRYQNCVWVPCLVVFVVVTGVSGKHFVNTPAPATVTQIFNFGATIAGYMIPWSALSSDYTAYFHPRVSRFVDFRGGLHQNLIFEESVGEYSPTRISVLIFLP